MLFHNDEQQSDNLNTKELKVQSIFMLIYFGCCIVKTLFFGYKIKNTVLTYKSRNVNSKIVMPNMMESLRKIGSG